MLKIATWNVNSLRVRLPQVLDWIKINKPTILALQETKVIDENFPQAAFEEIGYYAIFSGQKTYNGMASLSRKLPEDIRTALPNLEDSQKRVLATTYPITLSGKTYPLRVINLYIPNGESVGSQKYSYKLNWLEHLQKFAADEIQRYPYTIILGDFNIAPQPEDVYDPIKWEGKVLFSQPERAHFKQLLSVGFYDAFRLMDQEPNSFSWWDYRTFAFRTNRGARIDHILITLPLKKLIESCCIDKIPRAAEQPSDHAPVVASFSETI